MTFAPAPAMAGPALLTPEEEERLRQYQAALAAPQPQPATVGSALEAVAPAPQPAPAQVGTALQTVAPSAPANPPPAAYILPSILASGGHISQEVFDSLTSVEQQYLRDLRRAAPQGVAPGSDLAKQFEGYAKGLRDSTPQTYSFPDGSTVNMIGGQQISRSEADQPKRERIVAPDGTVYFSDVQTGQSIIALDENGNPLREKPRLSEGQRAEASFSQQRLDILNAQSQALAKFNPDDKVTWNGETLTFERSRVLGTKVKDLTEKTLKEIGQVQTRLDRALNPPVPNGSTPKNTPASTYSSAEQVRAAVRSGQLGRDAAIEILRTQFQYK